MSGHFADDNSSALFGGLNLNPRQLRQVDRILFIACGAAWHACLIPEYLIERYARILVEVEFTSEFIIPQLATRQQYFGNRTQPIWRDH